MGQDQLNDIEKFKQQYFSNELKQLSFLTNQVIYLQHRTGTNQQLQNSVANILAGALREAEVDNSKDLSAALTPLIINNIRQEIRNSKGELLEALYPLMGRMMASYVSSSIYKFIQNTNNRLERNLSPQHIWLRLKSLATGTPYKQLLLQKYNFVQINEIFLINKESGLLVDHWTTPDNQNLPEHSQSPDLISSMLTAINQFAAETYSASDEENSTDKLRSLEIGKTCLYLRATPLHLLVISCSGKANSQLENTFDIELIRLLDQHRDILAGNGNIQNQLSLRSVLPAFADRLNSLILEQIDDFELKRLNRKPVYALALLGMLAFVTTGWGTIKYVEAETRYKTKQTVENVLSSSSTFYGYPVNVRTSSDGKTVYLSGLLPTQEAIDLLNNLLLDELDDIQIISKITEIASVTQVKKTLGNVVTPVSATLQNTPEILQAKIETLNKQINLLEKRLNSRVKIPKLNQQPVPGLDLPTALSSDLISSDYKNITPDFNDPEVVKILEKTKKFKIPEKLTKNPLGIPSRTLNKANRSLGITSGQPGIQNSSQGQGTPSQGPISGTLNKTRSITGAILKPR